MKRMLYKNIAISIDFCPNTHQFYAIFEDPENQHETVICESDLTRLKQMVCEAVDELMEVA